MYENVAVGWTEAAAVEKFADCVIICTQDQLHKVFICLSESLHYITNSCFILSLHAYSWWTQEVSMKARMIADAVCL